MRCLLLWLLLYQVVREGVKEVDRISQGLTDRKRDRRTELDYGSIVWVSSHVLLAYAGSCTQRRS